MELRAISTRSTGWANSLWCNRKASRNSRRARLRTTAPPIRELVTTPSLEEDADSGSFSQLAMRHPVTNRSPDSRTRANSLACLRRAAGPNPRRARPRPVILFGLNRGQAFPPHSAPVAQYGSSTLLRVAAQKTVLPFAADLGRLILSLHNRITRSKHRKFPVNGTREHNSPPGGVKAWKTNQAWKNQPRRPGSIKNGRIR